MPKPKHTKPIVDQERLQSIRRRKELAQALLNALTRYEVLTEAGFGDTNWTGIKPADRGHMAELEAHIIAHQDAQDAVRRLIQHWGVCP